MSGHSHDEHHAAEQKPVAFAVPFYLAAATLLFLFFFLSLCDPKAHHEGEHDAHHATEATSGHAAATNEAQAPVAHETTVAADTTAADTSASHAAAAMPDTAHAAHH